MRSGSDAPPGRVRNRQQTEEALRSTLEDLRERGAKISISGLAKEVGVSAALIHNRYPDLAKEIRAATGKDLRLQRDAKDELLAKEKKKNRELRTEVKKLNKELVDLASINESLRVQLSLQSAIASGKVSKMTGH